VHVQERTKNSTAKIAQRELKKQWNWTIAFIYDRNICYLYTIFITYYYIIYMLVILTNIS
jgi:hypothetical protein